MLRILLWNIKCSHLYSQYQLKGGLSACHLGYNRDYSVYRLGLGTCHFLKGRIAAVITLSEALPLTFARRKIHHDTNSFFVFMVDLNRITRNIMHQYSNSVSSHSKLAIVYSAPTGNIESRKQNESITYKSDWTSNKTAILNRIWFSMRFRFHKKNIGDFMPQLELSYQ